MCSCLYLGYVAQFHRSHQFIITVYIPLSSRRISLYSRSVSEESQTIRIRVLTNALKKNPAPSIFDICTYVEVEREESPIAILKLISSHSRIQRVKKKPKDATPNTN